MFTCPKCGNLDPNDVSYCQEYNGWDVYRVEVEDGILRIGKHEYNSDQDVYDAYMQCDACGSRVVVSDDLNWNR